MARNMKAVFSVPGPDGGIFEFRDIPVPVPGAGEVLVAVRASGVNRGELIQQPLIRSSDPEAKTTRAGSEFAGEIISVGDGVSGWQPGDRVMGRAPGGYSEFVIANRRTLMRIPEPMTFAQAASIPTVFVTAHDALVTNANVKADESVLINAGSSGVGTAAIQIARHLGANPVIASTLSPAKGESLRRFGAHEAVDAGKPGWVGAVLAATNGHGIDVIIDNVGGPVLADNIRALALKGRLISVGRNAGKVGACDLDAIAFKRAAIIGVTFRTRTPDEALTAVERFSADLYRPLSIGALKPVLDRTFPFTQLADAHAYMLGNTQIGKIVLTMD